MVIFILKIIYVNEIFLSFLLMHYIATFNGGCLQNYVFIYSSINQRRHWETPGKLPTTTKIPFQGNGMAAISKSQGNTSMLFTLDH